MPSTGSAKPTRSAIVRCGFGRLDSLRRPALRGDLGRSKKEGWISAQIFLIFLEIAWGVWFVDTADLLVRSDRLSDYSRFVLVGAEGMV
jgi:hypothetical protein